MSSSWPLYKRSFAEDNQLFEQDINILGKSELNIEYVEVCFDKKVEGGIFLWSILFEWVRKFKERLRRKINNAECLYRVIKKEGGKVEVNYTAK